MLIHITQGTYGYRAVEPDGTISVTARPITRDDPPIDVGETEAKRLVAIGVAEYVNAEAVATAEKGRLNAESIKSALAVKSTSEGLTEPISDEAVTYSVTMKADELRSAMKARGLTVKVGMSKADMVEALNGDALPTFEPEDVIE